MGGATAGALIQQAALAIDAGMASAVACVFADTAKTGGSKFDAPAGRGDSWGIWGMFGNAADSAMTAHGTWPSTGRERAARLGRRREPQHASLNGHAVMREPITVEDHQSSRWIVDPLPSPRLLPDQRRRRLRDRDLFGARARVPQGRSRDLGDGSGAHAADLRARGVVVPAAPADASSRRTRWRALPGDVSRAALRQLHDLLLLWLEHGGFAARRGGTTSRAANASGSAETSR